MSLCVDVFEQNVASVPPLSPNRNRPENKPIPKATITVDARSPVPNRSRSSLAGSTNAWLQSSPFQNLETYAMSNMSPCDGSMSMSSFCFSSPGKFSPQRPNTFGSVNTPGTGNLNYRMSPDVETPLSSAIVKEFADELASPLFSPVLLSPYDATANRQGHRRGSASKLSLAQDFHDIKHSDSSHPDIFSTLSNAGTMSSSGRYSSMDAFPPGFASYRKAFPELLIPHDTTPQLPHGRGQNQSGKGQDLVGGYNNIRGRSSRTVGYSNVVSTDSADMDMTSDSHSSASVSPNDGNINATPMNGNRNPSASFGGINTIKSENRSGASFFSPAYQSKKSLPHNISPALSEHATPSHCNCKKSKCLKLYCECFAALRYCNTCKCLECNNRPDTEQARQLAIQVTKERNAGAFESKVTPVQGHSFGCNCKKSQCLKKYCECFEGDAYCGDNCKCYSCQNFSGSSQLELSRNLKNRKSFSPNSAKKVTLGGSVTFANSHPTPSSETRPLKRQRLIGSEQDLMYPFFGEFLPYTPKLIAVRCLEFLNGSDMYNMSLVNHLWCKATMDDALWENDE